MFENLELATDRLIAEGIPGNDVIVYKDGNEVFRSFKGFSDIENKIPMNGKEIYNMYSCSKPITATALMQLVEKKMIDLDDPLYKFIPEFKNMCVRTEDGIVVAKNYITIKHLLCMTAGLDYNTASNSISKAQAATNGKCATVETVKYLAEEPLWFEPGTKWNYSLCHDILAAVIEIISGIKFGEYMLNNIFKPLKMEKSTFLLPENKLHEICAQYTRTDNGLVNCGKNIQGYKFGTEYESGGAGLISTVEDYIKFLEAMRIGDVILKKETINLMQRDMMKNVDTSQIWFGPYSYGLGVRCAPHDKITNITDFGWGGAAGAYAAIDIINGYTLFYAMHVLNSNNLDGRKEILKSVRKDLKVE